MTGGQAGAPAEAVLVGVFPTASGFVEGDGVHGGALDVWLSALEADARIVVANPVMPAHGQTLERTLAADPAALYGAFSTTGSGLGLAIVADIVGNAYGLTEPEELVADGYIGTRIVEGSFMAWLHWPLCR